MAMEEKSGVLFHSFDEEMQKKGTAVATKETKLEDGGLQCVNCCRMSLLLSLCHFERRCKWRPVFLSITFAATQLPPPTPPGGPSVL